MQFPIEIIEERNTGWFKRLMVTPLSSKTYFTTKMIKTILLFLLAIILILLLLIYIKHKYEYTTMVAFRCFIMDRCKFILTLGLIIAQFNETQKQVV